MTDTTRDVALTFRLGEITLTTVTRRMVVRVHDPLTGRATSSESDLDLAALPADVEGVLYRSVSIGARQEVIKLDSNHVRYAPRQYERYFASLSTSYDQYLQSFSSKSRSNLRRKIRKFARASGGTIQWKCYKSPEDIVTFHELARGISKQSYQERLLDAGLPDHDRFRKSMIDAASAGAVRGYLIFLDEKPVAYLYCPIRDGVVRYAYLGYLSTYNELSPGTVLLWLAMEELFNEGCHRFFDFTEGGDRSKHSQKRLFATDSVFCADIYVFRRNVTNTSIVLAHAGSEWLVERIGALLELAGVKKLVRRATRRLWGAAPRASET